MTFRLPRETRQRLQVAAEEERRSMSDLALIILTEWLDARGERPAAATKARRRRA